MATDTFVSIIRIPNYIGGCKEHQMARWPNIMLGSGVKDVFLLIDNLDIIFSR